MSCIARCFRRDHMMCSRRGLVEAAHLADARLSDKMLSQHGHVVIRVAPGGDRYEVFVLDDTREDGAVVSRWGPYVS